MRHGGFFFGRLVKALAALGAMVIVNCSSGDSTPAPPTATTTVLNASSLSTNTGTPVALTATVAPSVASGTVAFYDATTSTTLGSVTLASGQAVCQATFSVPGPHLVRATFAPSSTSYVESQSSAVSIAAFTPTATALTSAPAHVTVLTPVTLTATVTPASATGTVTFFVDAISLGSATLGSGTATLAHTFATAGDYAITATYNGDSVDATSTSTNPLSIVSLGTVATTTTLAADDTAPSTTTSVTLTAAVSPSEATGTVTFFANDVVLGTAAVGSGTATLARAFLASGAYVLTATYNGDLDYAASTSANALALTSSLTSTTTTVRASASDLTTETMVTLTAWVTSPPNGGPTSLGLVRFVDNGKSLGTGLVASDTGTASLDTLLTPGGWHSVWAEYEENATYAGSSSSSLSFSVTSLIGNTPSTLLQTADALAPTTTTSVTLTAVMVPSAATGTVTFSANSVQLGTASLQGGIATLAHTFGSAGAYAITSAYGGDPTFAPATSANALSLSSSLTGTMTMMQTSTDTATPATVVTLTATVISSTTYLPAASGTVTFLDGGVPIGTGTVNATGKATLDVLFSVVGYHSLEARYEVNATYSGSTSSMGNVYVSN